MNICPFGSLWQVVFEILKVLLCCFMLVLGFTHSFKVIFLDVRNNNMHIN